MSDEYTDEKLEKEFPERPRKCKYDKCKKSFLTRFDAKYCSDRCFMKDIRDLRKKLGTWVTWNKRAYTKSERNDKNKDTLLIKGTGRRKK